MTRELKLMRVSKIYQETFPRSFLWQQHRRGWGYRTDRFTYVKWEGNLHFSQFAHKFIEEVPNEPGEMVRTPSNPPT